MMGRWRPSPPAVRKFSASCEECAASCKQLLPGCRVLRAAAITGWLSSRAVRSVVIPSRQAGCHPEPSGWLSSRAVRRGIFIVPTEPSLGHLRIPRCARDDTLSSRCPSPVAVARRPFARRPPPAARRSSLVARPPSPVPGSTTAPTDIPPCELSGCASARRRRARASGGARRCVCPPFDSRRPRCVPTPPA